MGQGTRKFFAAYRKNAPANRGVDFSRNFIGLSAFTIPLD
jgi:hypothetical protein